MKPFNLEEHLTDLISGKKFAKTRDGRKVRFIFNGNELGIKDSYTLVGYVQNRDKTEWDSETESWTAKGMFYCGGSTSDLDIIGLWQETQPLVNMGELPAPIKKAEIGGHYYFLSFKQNNTRNAIVESISYCPIVDFHCYLLNSGQLFATKADCQAWLDAMQGARR